MDSPTTGADDELEVPTLGQICQRLDTMDGKLDRVVEKVDRQTDLLISLVQRTAAPDAAPTNSAHLAAHTAASGATGVAHGASSASHTLTTSAVARPGNTHPLAPSATSGSTGVAQGSSPASDTRPATPGTRSDNTRTMVSKGKGKGKGRPRQEDIPEPLPAPKYLAVDETELPWDDEGCGYSPVASTSAVMHRAQPSRAAQSGLGARMPVRDHGSTDELCDAMGVVINSDRVSSLLAMFVFMSLDIIPIAYALIFGCSPFRHDISRVEFNRHIAKMARIKLVSILELGPSSNFLLCQGTELEDRRQNLATRLRLTHARNAVVPAPLLCYSLVTLACMRVEELTGAALSTIFREVTKRELSSLRIATENGVERLDANRLCEMAKQWVYDIKASDIEGDIVQESLSIAQKCNRIYLDRCHRDGVNGAINDADGLVAANMLASNVCFSRLLLGLQPIHLEVLIRFESCLIEGE